MENRGGGRGGGQDGEQTHSPSLGGGGSERGCTLLKNKSDEEERKTVKLKTREDVDYMRAQNKKSYHKRMANEQPAEKKERLAHRREAKAEKRKNETEEERDRRNGLKRDSYHRCKAAKKKEEIDKDNAKRNESRSKRRIEDDEYRREVNEYDSELKRKKRTPHFLLQEYRGRNYSLHLVDKGTRPNTYYQYMYTLKYFGVTSSEFRFDGHVDDILAASNDDERTLKCQLADILWRGDQELICISGPWIDNKKAYRDENAALKYLFKTREHQLWNHRNGGGMTTSSDLAEGENVLKKLYLFNEATMKDVPGRLRDESSSLNTGAASVRTRKLRMMKSLMLEASRIGAQLGLSDEKMENILKAVKQYQDVREEPNESKGSRQDGCPTPGPWNGVGHGRSKSGISSCTEKKEEEEEMEEEFDWEKEFGGNHDVEEPAHSVSLETGGLVPRIADGFGEGGATIEELDRTITIEDGEEKTYVLRNHEKTPALPLPPPMDSMPPVTRSDSSAKRHAIEEIACPSLRREFQRSHEVAKGEHHPPPDSRAVIKKLEMMKKNKKKSKELKKPPLHCLKNPSKKERKVSCPCGSVDDKGEEMALCEICDTMWLHVNCFKSESKKIQVVIYLCLNCDPRPIETTARQVHHQQKVVMKKGMNVERTQEHKEVKSITMSESEKGPAHSVSLETGGLVVQPIASKIGQEQSQACPLPHLIFKMSKEKRCNPAFKRPSAAPAPLQMPKSDEGLSSEPPAKKNRID